MTKLPSRALAASVFLSLAAWNCRGAAGFALRGGFDLGSIGCTTNVVFLFVCSTWLLRKRVGLDGRTVGADPLAAGDPWDQVALSVLLIFILNAVLLALAPPTEWDVLSYHLALPKLYLKARRVYEIPWLFHSHYPHLLELIYAPLLALDERLPALLHAAVCLAWVTAVYQASAKRLGTRLALAAAALCAAQPVVLRFSGVAHSDGGLALFSWLSCTAVWDWAEEGGDENLVRAGLFAGLGASCKLLGLAPAAALTLVVFWKGGFRRGLRFALPAAFVAAPWLVKNWAWAGDPVWPFLPRLFSPRFGGSALAGPLLASARAPHPLLNLAASAPPLAWAALGGAAVRLSAGRRSCVPLWLWLPACALLAAACNYDEAWRFLWPAFPLLAFSAVEGLPRGAALAAALGVLSLPCGNPAFAALGLRPSSGAADRRGAYLSRALDHYAFYRSVDRLLAGKPARVLLFREIRGYHLDADYLWGDPVNQGLLRYGEMKDPDALLARLRELGVTHVLVNGGIEMYQPGATYYSPRTAALMDAALERGRRVLRADPLALFELPAARIVK